MIQIMIQMIISICHENKAGGGLMWDIVLLIVFIALLSVLIYLLILLLQALVQLLNSLFSRHK